MNKRQRKKYIMRALSKAYDESVKDKREGSVFIATQKHLITEKKILVAGVTRSLDIELNYLRANEISIEGYSTETVPLW
ncbi:hypothetical protein [Streptococcus gallolyticus]|uniref:hypothetical protein n=1 Tax=Streptococcus gallolyticus TaxID=315405 RepID=UPI002284E27F|nr:hypothetical protein [Streptococcus gallolyticus]MCY7166387.1 hypothetical protein [Streptococcus gallolyticus subsp. gallolyticus]MCY7183775.1 hypothetical protein [Streptococcus gallolyticus subsp. gallolyticus]